MEKVSGEFETEVLTELQSGRAEALSTIEAARRETSGAVAKVLETGAKQAESVKRQIVGGAELESRNAQLRSLEKGVSEVFELAMKEVSGITGAAQEKALTHLIEEGLGVLGPKARVMASAKDKKAATAAVKNLNGGQVRLAFDDQPVETIGGVVLTSDDGSVKFDNTFEARLERMRPNLRKEVAGLLTGQ